MKLFRVSGRMAVLAVWCCGVVYAASPIPGQLESYGVLKREGTKLVRQETPWCTRWHRPCLLTMR